MLWVGPLTMLASIAAVGVVQALAVVLLSPVPLTDTEVAGVPIGAGAIVICHLGSANHDAAHFADPETFKLNRENVKEHLSFGLKPGAAPPCCGSQVWVKEVRVVIASGSPWSLPSLPT